MSVKPKEEIVDLAHADMRRRVMYSAIYTAIVIWIVPILFVIAGFLWSMVGLGVFAIGLLNEAFPESILNSWSPQPKVALTIEDNMVDYKNSKTKVIVEDQIIAAMWSTGGRIADTNLEAFITDLADVSKTAVEGIEKAEKVGDKIGAKFNDTAVRKFFRERLDLPKNAALGKIDMFYDVVDVKYMVGKPQVKGKHIMATIGQDPRKETKYSQEKKGKNILAHGDLIRLWGDNFRYTINGRTFEDPTFIFITREPIKGLAKDAVSAVPFIAEVFNDLSLGVKSLRSALKIVIQRLDNVEFRYQDLINQTSEEHQAEQFHLELTGHSTEQAKQELQDRAEENKEKKKAWYTKLYHSIRKFIGAHKIGVIIAIVILFFIWLLFFAHVIKF